MQVSSSPAVTPGKPSSPPRQTEDFSQAVKQAAEEASTVADVFKNDPGVSVRSSLRKAAERRGVENWDGEAITPFVSLLKKNDKALLEAMLAVIDNPGATLSGTDIAVRTDKGDGLATEGIRALTTKKGPDGGQGSTIYVSQSYVDDVRRALKNNKPDDLVRAGDTLRQEITEVAFTAGSGELFSKGDVGAEVAQRLAGTFNKDSADADRLLTEDDIFSVEVETLEDTATITGEALTFAKPPKLATDNKFENRQLTINVGSQTIRGALSGTQILKYWGQLADKFNPSKDPKIGYVVGDYVFNKSKDGKNNTIDIYAVELKFDKDITGRTQYKAVNDEMARVIDDWDPENILNKEYSIVAAVDDIDESLLGSILDADVSFPTIGLTSLRSIIKNFGNKLLDFNVNDAEASLTQVINTGSFNQPLFAISTNLSLAIDAASPLFSADTDLDLELGSGREIQINEKGVPFPVRVSKDLAGALIKQYLPSALRREAIADALKEYPAATK